MGLNWIGLGSVGVPHYAESKAMHAEMESINAAVAEVHDLRAKADRESDEISAVWPYNKGVDRTKLFAAAAAAYQAEVAVRERITVFYRAVQIAAQRAKQEAAARLAEYEAGAMKAYNLSPDQPFPAAMKQTDHVWQEAFRKVLDAECFTVAEPLRENASILPQIASEAKRYRGELANEKRRVETIQKSHPQPTEGERQLDAAREKRQAIFDQAVELLGAK